MVQEKIAFGIASSKSIQLNEWMNESTEYVGLSLIQKWLTIETLHKWNIQHDVWIGFIVNLKSDFHNEFSKAWMNGRKGASSAGKENKSKRVVCYPLLNDSCF